VDIPVEKKNFIQKTINTFWDWLIYFVVLGDEKSK
jgi:hypothetical protein